MHNGNETWHILKSIYVEKTSIIFFQDDCSILLLRAKITCATENALTCHIVVFSFDYIFVNDNKSANNYPKPSDL